MSDELPLGEPLDWHAARRPGREPLLGGHVLLRPVERFGFDFEGVFLQHQVVKARNRDTAWYAITDRSWPAIRAGFRSWLAAENFDAGGRQHRPLGELIAGERARA
jgi:hypothetical protein